MATIRTRLLAMVCIFALAFDAAADDSDGELTELGFLHGVALEMPGTRRESDYRLHDAVMRFSELVMTELRYQEQLALDAEYQRLLGYHDQQLQDYERAQRRRAWNIFTWLFPFLFTKPEPPETPEAQRSDLFDEAQFRERQLEYLKGYIGVCPEQRRGYVYLRQRHIKTSCFEDVEAAVNYFNAYSYRLTTEFDRTAVNAAVLKITGRPLVDTPVPEPEPKPVALPEPAPAPASTPPRQTVAAPAVAQPKAAGAPPASGCDARALNHMQRLLLEQGRSVLAYQLMIDYIDFILAQQSSTDGTAKFDSVDGFFNQLFPGVGPRQRESVLDKLRQNDVAAGRDGAQTEGVFYSADPADADSEARRILTVKVLDRASEFERSTIAMGWMAAALDAEQPLRQRISGFNDLAVHLQELLGRALRSDEPALRRSLLRSARDDARLELDTLLQGIRRDSRGFERACLAATLGNAGDPAPQLPGRSAVDFVLDRVDSINGGRGLQQRNPVLGRGR